MPLRNLALKFCEYGLMYVLTEFYPLSISTGESADILFINFNLPVVCVSQVSHCRDMEERSTDSAHL